MKDKNEASDLDREMAEESDIVRENDTADSDSDEKEKKAGEQNGEKQEETPKEDLKEEEKNEVAGGSPEEKKEEQEDADTRYLRLAADFQNFKKRVEREKSEIYAYANEKIALDIIEVMDNFERALEHSEECADKQFAEGIGMIYKQLKNVLDKNNIVEIKAEGEDFDPNFHNAVMAEENPDFESGKVIQALQKGYTLNDKVIRPSMVRVAQ